MPRNSTAVVACLGALLVAAPARGQLTFDTLAEFGEKGAATAILSDADSGPPPAAITSEVFLPPELGGAVEFETDAFARASVAFGFSAVEVDGVFVNPPVNPTGQLLAVARTSETITNTTGMAQSYDFNFLIRAPFLRVADFAGFGPDDVNTPMATYEVEFLLDGVSVFSSSATLRGGRLGTVLTETGTDLGGDAFSPGDLSVMFDDFSSTLALGTFAAGQSFTFETRYTAMISSASFELGGIARVGDPNDLDLGGNFGQIVPASGVIPEPPASILCLAGGLTLAGLGLLRRRPLLAVG